MRNEWEIKKLVEVCEFSNGQAHEKFVDDNGEYILVNSKFISSEGEVIKRTNKQLSALYKDDIVFVMSDVPNGKALAKCFLIDKNDTYTLNQRICVIRSENYDIKYLFYHLNRHQYLLSFNNGENQTNLRKNDILNCPLVTPPLPEQKHIVSILDKAFAAIAKAKANAEQNLNNAKEIFESYLLGVFENGHDWKKTTLGNVCSLITDGKHGNCKDEENSGFYFLSAKDVRNDTLLFDNGRQITEPDFLETHRRTDLKPGDICLINTGATIGRMAFAPDDSRTYRTTFQKSVAVVKTIPELINNKFCAYILKADLKTLVKISAGTAVPNLLLGDMKKHKISVPKSLEEQAEIVARLDNVYSESQKLQTIYQKKLDDLEELKKSILHKAFNGELKTEVK